MNIRWFKAHGKKKREKGIKKSAWKFLERRLKGKMAHAASG